MTLRDAMFKTVCSVILIPQSGKPLSLCGPLADAKTKEVIKGASFADYFRIHYGWYRVVEEVVIKSVSGNYFVETKGACETV